MANLSELEGTPWQITYLKSNEDGKRDRRSCKFYISGDDCSKGGRCHGGRYCLEFEKKEKIKAKNRFKIENNVIGKEKVSGSFTIKFDDDKELITKRIGKDINEEALLVDIVKNTPINGKFEINGEKGIVINKDIKSNHFGKHIEKENSKNRYDLVKDAINHIQQNVINKNIVEYGDIVKVLCIDDNKEIELEIKDSVFDKNKDLIGRCKKNKINYEFRYYGKKYKIINIKKNVVWDD